MNSVPEFAFVVQLAGLRDQGIHGAPQMHDVQIHESAVVDLPADIGAGTRIWHFTHIMSGATIGRDCSIGQNCFVATGARIGHRCKLQNNVSVYDGVVLDDEVFCGPSVVFTNVMNPRAFIERKSEYRTTFIHRGATLGANATIICGGQVGRYALVGAGCVVTHDVPDYAVVAGVPGRVRGWVSRAGHRLDFDSAGLATCPESGEHYRRVEADNRIELIGTPHLAMSAGI